MEGPRKTMVSDGRRLDGSWKSGETLARHQIYREVCRCAKVFADHRKVYEENRVRVNGILDRGIIKESLENSYERFITQRVYR